MQLNAETYHSPVMNRKYMSFSQYKNFLELYGGCEARTMAVLKGEWEEKEKKAFLIGNYVHSWAEGKEAFQKFIDLHYENIYKSRGTGKYKVFKQADQMINIMKKDKFIQKVLAGGNEKIFTAELFGIKWKAMVDVFNPKKKTFTDLKTTRSINRKYYSTYYQDYLNFIDFYGYDFQMAIYAEIIRKSRGDDKYFMPHILAVTKEEPPDKEVINFPVKSDFIQSRLNEIEINMARIKKVWNGKEEPLRCGNCNYCRATKELKGATFYTDFQN